MNEAKVSSEEIVNEILVLLKDEFVAKCLSCGNQITMTLLNGQHITIDITVS